MSYVALFLITSALLYVVSWFVLRAMARIPRRVTFTPANTISLIVTEEDNSGDGTKGGGNLVNALHAVPGKTLDKKSDPDPMNWKFVDGEDPEHDNFLFKELGIQDMGGWFYTTRMNIDRRMRFGWEKKPGSGEQASHEELQTIAKTQKTKHVFYSGEMTVRIENADTSDKLGLNFEIDFAFARKFPVRSILRLADATAFLTSRVHSFVNSQTASKEAAYYYGGEDVGEHREALAHAIDEEAVELKKQIEEQLGLEITMVSIRDVDMLEKHRELMEKEITATKTAKANLITAEGEAAQEIARAKGKNEAGKLETDVTADRITRVYKEVAKDDKTLAAFTTDTEAAAYRENTTVTTFAPGKKMLVSADK